MSKLFSYILLVGMLYACSTVHYDREATPPDAVRIPEDYRPKNLSDKRQTLLKEGEKLIGTRYRYGGTNPKGFDCSGFTSYVYDKINVDLSRSSSAQSKDGRSVKLKEVKTGDLIFFDISGNKRISHVAMVVSNDSRGIRVLHSTSSKGVRKDNISQSKYWNPKILFARRIIN